MKTYVLDYLLFSAWFELFDISVSWDMALRDFRTVLRKHIPQKKRRAFAVAEKKYLASPDRLERLNACSQDTKVVSCVVNGDCYELVIPIEYLDLMRKRAYSIKGVFRYRPKKVMWKYPDATLAFIAYPEVKRFTYVIPQFVSRIVRYETVCRDEWFVPAPQLIGFLLKDLKELRLIRSFKKNYKKGEN
jgi:hypothetical protein